MQIAAIFFDLYVFSVAGDETSSFLRFEATLELLYLLHLRYLVVEKGSLDSVMELCER